MTTIETTTAPEYFAVLDPLDPGRITYWYRVQRGRDAGQLAPWPPRTRYGALYVKDMPAGTKAEQYAFARAHYDRVAHARAVLEDVIDTDPDTAAARFAAFASRCCCCGKRLTDERSKCYGIGPECRHGASLDWLASRVDLVGRAHAERLAKETTA